MKIKFNIEVEVDEEGKFELFGCTRFICPDHLKTDYDSKTCFLDQLENSFSYAYSHDDKLAKDAQRLKRDVLEAVVIERI